MPNRARQILCINESTVREAQRQARAAGRSLEAQFDYWAGVHGDVERNTTPSGEPIAQFPAGAVKPEGSPPYTPGEPTQAEQPSTSATSSEPSVSTLPDVPGTPESTVAQIAQSEEPAQPDVWPHEPFEAHFAHRTRREQDDVDAGFPVRRANKPRFYRYHPRLIDLVCGLRDHLTDKAKQAGLDGTTVSLGDLFQDALGEYLKERYRELRIDPNTIPMYDEEGTRAAAKRRRKR